MNTKLSVFSSYTYKEITLIYGSTQNWHKLIVKKRGYNCVLSGVLVLPKENAWVEHNVFLFPDGFKPLHPINVQVYDISGNVCRLIYLNNDGYLSVRYTENINEPTEYWLNIAYIS